MTTKGDARVSLTVIRNRYTEPSGSFVLSLLSLIGTNG